MNKIKKIIIALSLLLFNTNVFAYSTTTCVIGSNVTEERCEANLFCYGSATLGYSCSACSAPTTPTELYPYSAAGSDANTDCYACTQTAIANGTWAPDSLIYYPTGAPSPTCTYTNPDNISCSSNMYYKVPDSTEPYGYRCAFKIILDDNGGTGGDGTIYNVYGVKYLDQSGNLLNGSVTRPTKANSAFTGYYYSSETPLPHESLVWLCDSKTLVRPNSTYGHLVNQPKPLSGYHAGGHARQRGLLNDVAL